MLKLYCENQKTTDSIYQKNDRVAFHTKHDLVFFAVKTPY